jgi:large subunit ribosomal protein L5
MQAFGYKNVMQVPKLEKVVVNVGAGDAKDNAKLMDQIVAELALITGQKPVVTKAKKSIANFHLREGMPVGCKVTLRGDRMYEFLDRMISVALPRVRDFKGVSGKGFDGRGNYTLGLTEQIIFPEVDLEKVEKVKGMNVCIATTAKTDEECKELLRLFGMPFRN